MEASAPAVSIVGLVKHYGRIEAVRGIDLQVAPGEVFGFLGPNGSGKTTTVRTLLGLLRPTAGSVSSFGRDAWRDGVAVRRRIGYVPGELRLPDQVTGAHLAGSFGRMRGGLDAAGRERRDKLADRLKLDLGRPLRDLSSGNRRKLAVLLAFLPQTDLLVLDEPTSGLDPLMQHEVLGLVREAKARGAAVFLSSHVLSEVQRVADRVAIVRAGRIVAAGTVAELRGSVAQRVEAWFDADPPLALLAAVPGLSALEADGRRVRATLAGPVGPLLQVLAAHEPASLIIDEPDLETTFLDLYSGASDAGGPES